MNLHQKQVLNSPVKLSSHGDILWLRDSAGIFVFHPRRQKYWLLAGLEGDLWDWFVLGHPLNLITERFALMTHTSKDMARQGVMRFVQYMVQEEIWVEAS